MFLIKTTPLQFIKSAIVVLHKIKTSDPKSTGAVVTAQSDEVLSRQQA